MKKLLLLTLPIIGMAGCASVPTSNTTAMTSYQRIVDVPNVKQDMIYEGARQWIAKSFNSANSVIQYQDKSTGSIIGKGSMPFPCKGMECLADTKKSLQFTIKVDSKDNKARVSFDDLKIYSPAYVSSTLRMPESTRNLYGDDEQTRAKALLDNTIDNLAGDIVKTGTTDKNW